MKSIIYIVVYMGKFDEFFNFWLLTCRYNPTIDFLIITDDNRKFDYPNNVHVVYRNLDWVKSQFQKLYDFDIKLDNPYKLCDYKPAYGEAFAELIEGYDFWGHCDIDLLWGDIRDYLTEDVLDKYDRIGFLGHSIIYRNNKENNRRYRLGKTAEDNYRKVFSTNENCFFDERGVNYIYDKLGVPYYKKQIFADLTEYKYNFYLTNVPKEDAYKNGKQIFYWNKGKLERYYLVNNRVFKDEFMYIHFLKRKMKLLCSTDNQKLMIIPNNITNRIEEPSVSVIKKYSKPHWVRYFIMLAVEKRDKISIRNVIRFIIRRSKKYYNLRFNNHELNDRKN